MSIASQLELLQQTKSAIKTAIQNKGVPVGDEDSFASYADKIENIAGYGENIDISKIDYSIGNSSILKISDGRILQGFVNMSGYHTRPLASDGTWLDIDWNKSFEIGIAFKYTVADTNQTLFGSGISGAQYYKCPMIMLHPASQQFEIDISTTGNSWDMTMSQTVTYTSLAINTWYFLKMTFNQSDMSLVIQISNNFSIWDTLLNITMSAAYYHDTASLCFGGFVQNSSFSSNNLFVDTFNTYIKDDTGEIVWGAFAGRFGNGEFPISGTNGGTSLETIYFGKESQWLRDSNSSPIEFDIKTVGNRFNEYLSTSDYATFTALKDFNAIITVGAMEDLTHTGVNPPSCSFFVNECTSRNKSGTDRDTGFMGVTAANGQPGTTAFTHFLFSFKTGDTMYWGSINTYGWVVRLGQIDVIEGIDTSGYVQPSF